LESLPGAWEDVTFFQAALKNNARALIRSSVELDS